MTGKQMQQRGLEKLTRGAVAITMVAATLAAVASPAGAADNLSAMNVATAAELASAITAANGDDGAEVITVTADLTLTSSLPPITGPIAIVGSEMNQATTIDAAGFRLLMANGAAWTEPVGAPAETRLAVKVQNVTITGGQGGGGSVARLVRVHATIEDVDFVSNVGGWEGNIYAQEGGTTLRLNRISVTGQTSTLVYNDHGGAPHEVLDVNGQPTLTEADYNNRLYVTDSTFAANPNAGCVMYTHRWVSISDSTFSNSGQVCVNGVSTSRIARTSFVGTVLSLGHPWWNYWGPRYVTLDAVSVRPSVNLETGSIHVLANDTTVCGQSIASYTWANPTTTGTVIGNCTPTAPTWIDQQLPALALGEAVDDGVSAGGDPAPTYSVASGALPTGLVLNATTGSVTGTPTAAGDFVFELAATNDTGMVSAAFSGTIPSPIVPALPPAPAGPETLIVPVDGAPGDGDGSLDGSVQVRASNGVRISLAGVSTTQPDARLVLSDLERPELDRGMTSTGVPARIEARDLTFQTADICLSVRAVEGRAHDRIRLLWLDGTDELDITDEVIDDEGRLLVCGRTDRLGTFRAVLLAGDRFAGSDRYSTAAELALGKWSNANTVFVASGEQHADAVVAGVLAAADDAPVLLVRSTSLPPSAAHALSTLRPQRIVVVGGRHAVHPEVVAELAAFAPSVEVTAGGDRHETAARAAADFGTGEVVYLAAGDRFADAVAAGSAAVNAGAAFLSTDQSALPQSTRTSLLQLDPARVVITGGPSAISDAVVRSVEQLLPAATVERVGGLDRYLTASQLSAGSGHAPVVAATGGDFADLVAAMTVATPSRGSIILVPPAGLTPALHAGLAAREPDHVTVVGGVKAISAATELGLARVQRQSRPGTL